MSGLSCRGIVVELGSSRIVDGVDLSVVPGQWVSVIGPNGAGKSTLLRALLGLVPYAGTVTIDGDDAAPLSRRDRARRLAYLPQAPATP